MDTPKEEAALESVSLLPSRGLSQDRARNRALATLSQLPARRQVPEQLMSMFWVSYMDSDDDNPASPEDPYHPGDSPSQFLASADCSLILKNQFPDFDIY